MSPPTVDLVGDRVRPGGPGIYAGLALKMLGARPTLVGPVGYMTLRTSIAEERLGLHRWGYRVTGPGAVFRLVYTSRGRLVEPLSRPPGLDPGLVSKAAGERFWSIALVSPLAGEEAGQVLPLLWGRARLVVVDTQGYSRSNMLGVVESRGLYQILHASRGEEPGRIYGAAIYTDGMAPIRVTGPGLHEVVDPIGPELSDPTGAGDVFTALVALMVSRGRGVVEAVREAASLVPRLLPRVQEELEGVWSEVLP